MCMVLIALGLIGLVCSITAQYFSAKAASGFGTGVRHALFEHIQSLTFTEMDMIGSSTLITRLTSDINQNTGRSESGTAAILRSPFIVFGAMIMAFTVDVQAALIFVVVIPILSVIVFGVMLVTMPLYRKVQSHLDSVLLTTRENLAGARVIRAFNKEKEERERFEEEKSDADRCPKICWENIRTYESSDLYCRKRRDHSVIYAGAVRVNMGDLTQGEVVCSCQLYVTDSCGARKAC